MPFRSPAWRFLPFVVASLFIWPAAVRAASPESGAEESSTVKAADQRSFSEQDLEFFEKRVRPILAARCFECHSSSAQEPKGGLKLDTRAGALAGGDTGPAVVPSKADESLLIDAIRYGDVYQMPPKSKLPADEIAALERWVNLGAPWPKETPSSATTQTPTKFDLAARRDVETGELDVVARPPFHRRTVRRAAHARLSPVKGPATSRFRG